LDLARPRHAQGAVPDAFDGFDGIRKPFDRTGVSLDRHNLQTIRVIQMDMLRRFDHILKVMLDINDFIQKIPPVMVVDVNNGAGDVLIIRPLLLQQFLPDQITDRLRPVRVLSLPDQAVKLFQKRRGQGNSKPDDLRHILPSSMTFRCGLSTMQMKSQGWQRTGKILIDNSLQDIDSMRQIIKTGLS
jgi:hypothetical protein